MIDHLIHLILLLLLARFLGEVAARLGQPALVGEILAGLLLALAALYGNASFLLELADSTFLDLAAEFGIFFLLLLAGLEIAPSELFRHSARSVGVALGGVVVPLTLGFALAWVVIPENPLLFVQALLVGVALAISAVPVAIGVFMDLGMLHTSTGRTVVAAAILDDVAGLVLLALLVGAITMGSVPGIEAMIWVVGKAALFFLIAGTTGYFAASRIADFVARLRVPASEFSALLLLALAFSGLAEMLGLDFILGPFVAGLFFDAKNLGAARFARLKATTSDMTLGLFAPLFFVSIGIRADFAALTVMPGFVISLIVIALLGKVLGAGVPAWLSGLTRKEALGVGIGMSGRGAVELVIVSIALEAGLFDHPDPVIANLFSALVLMALVTTILTPIGLRFLFRNDENSGL
ncbi:cation:proton antiporter [Erythrobacter sp. SN021]|uniref:cation:proton antiporter n=1 Tax=Erythrobacter sp. SN021 TaxID=2912574 RepID=UPI001F340C03|nr:cation:proton antiporter [Erythrobacter sp. SN021]MCF8882063.1 cation:proton antiporter [Erythrobacter sp. SN021]